jgi:preprotein translocase subunit SecF
MATATAAGRTGKKNGVFHRLATGTDAFDMIGPRKRKWYYVLFGALILISLVSILVRGFNFSIEFAGGTQIQLPADGAHGVISVSQVTDVYTKSLGQEPASVQAVGNGAQASIQIRSDTLSQAQTAQVETALFNQLQPKGANGQPTQQAISDSAVSASWGSQISEQALIGLIIFLVLVAVFLSIYFERWMALAALIALANDLIVTAGVYSLSGFQVSPPTVIGMLTILGFSLYDAVVVFDKVRENTRGLLGLTRQTFGEAANLALNQTLMRSINTSLIALLPVLGLLIVGVGVLGVGTLTDLALVQLVGMLSGAASSLFLASPLLVAFKMRQEPYRKQAKRVLARREQLAKRAAQRSAAGEEGARPADEVADPAGALVEDEDIAEEQRRERAYAAASGVPARTPKAADRNRSNRSPSTKSGRPSGKRRR